MANQVCVCVYEGIYEGVAHLSEPELEVLDGGRVHPLAVRLLQLLALLRRLRRQVLPLLHQLLNAVADRLLGVSTLVLLYQLWRHTTRSSVQGASQGRQPNRTTDSFHTFNPNIYAQINPQQYRAHDAVAVNFKTTAATFIAVLCTPPAASRTPSVSAVIACHSLCPILMTL